MIKSTLRELMQGKLDDVDMEGVYLIRAGEDVLYVGRSVDVVSRLVKHATNYVGSHIADLIHLNRPQSWDWQIELRTPEECREIVEMYAPLYRDDKEIAIPIESAEMCMIRHYCPYANTANNPNRSHKPAHVKNVYDVYPIEPGATDNLF